MPTSTSCRACTAARPRAPTTSSAGCCSSSARSRMRARRGSPPSCRTSAMPARTGAPSRTIRSPRGTWPRMFEAVGTDCIVTLDVHNPAAFENAFRCRTVTLTAAPLFVEYVARLLPDGALSVVSPDPGGAKRAELFREALESAVASADRQGIRRQAPQRRRGHRRSVRRRCRRRDRAGDRRPDQHRRHAAARRPRRARGGRAAGARTGDAWPVHAGGGRGRRRPRDRAFRVTDAVPPFRLGAGAGAREDRPVARRRRCSPKRFGGCTKGTPWPTCS